MARMEHGDVVGDIHEVESFPVVEVHIEVGILVYCNVAEDFLLDNAADAFAGLADMAALDAIGTGFLVEVEYEVSAAFVVVDQCLAVFLEAAVLLFHLENHLEGHLRVCSEVHLEVH
jgi:hypothetical protein